VKRKILVWENRAACDKTGSMKHFRILLSCLVACVLFLPVASPAADGQGAKIRVLVVTGGHDFEREPFFKLFKDNSEITFEAVEHPNFHAWLKAENASKYDVIVAYDMHQEITDEAKANFLARLKEGKGLVVMHHAIASYQDWPEYAKIIGAKYYLQKTNVNGVVKLRSQYQHDVQIPVTIADPTHPVTKGLKDYVIHDETYKLFDVFEDTHALLKTKEPLSNEVIAWSKTYGPARVVYIQSGHDHFAYENPNLQQLLKQAIRWTAKKD
jgi:type 1 glutamine amidotransferase